jgi:probable F420-dependent oxidoreductase
MAFRRLETILLHLDVEQYAGKGQVATSVESVAAAARKIEALGWDGATSPEAGHDPFLPLAIAAEHTSRIVLATNVAIAFPRSPLVVAQTAWDLQQYAKGRFHLGLGTQVKGHNERRYAAPWTAPPGPRLREYILCLRAMFQTFQNGAKPTYFEGQHYRFTSMPPFFNPGPIAHPHVPIYIAAVNRYMARLAGELCDGLRLHPIATFAYTRDVVLPTIDAGARKGGRTRADVDVIGAPFLALGKDAKAVEAAKADIKQRVAFYGSTRTYHAVFEFHGWQELGQRLHQMSLEGKWTEMPRLISDEMLEEFAIVGTYDELARKVKQRCGGVFSTMLLDLPPGLREDDDRVQEILRELRAA